MVWYFREMPPTLFCSGGGRGEIKGIQVAIKRTDIDGVIDDGWRGLNGVSWVKRPLLCQTEDRFCIQRLLIGISTGVLCIKAKHDPIR